MPRTHLICVLLILSASAVRANDALEHSLEELRTAVGPWNVTTEFLNEDGSVASTAEGNYEFEWVIPDRLLSGRSSIPAASTQAGILFYVSEERGVIEMVAVHADGKLWVMTGELGGNVRYSKEFETSDGGTGQLRFTRFNVTDEGFESKMEYTSDGGESWTQGNHQVFRRAD